jgi:hypothetical protein
LAEGSGEQSSGDNISNWRHEVTNCWWRLCNEELNYLYSLLTSVGVGHVARIASLNNLGVCQSLLKMWVAPSMDDFCIECVKSIGSVAFR